MLTLTGCRGGSTAAPPARAGRAAAASARPWPRGRGLGRRRHASASSASLADGLLHGPDRPAPRRPPGGPAPPGRRGRACRAAPGRDRPRAGPRPRSRWIAGGSWNRRSVFVTADRLLPTRVATSFVGEAEVLDQLLVGGRLLEGVEILAMEVLDQRLLERADRRRTSRTMAGIDRRARPAWRPASAARRRSARSGRRPAGARAPAGARPSSRTDAVSDGQGLLVEVPRVAGAGWARWRRRGTRAGRRRRRRVGSALSAGISAPSPLPSPLRRATAHLLGQLAVGDGAPRASDRTR